MLQDKRVHKALGENYRVGMSCSEFGTAISESTVGPAPGQHSLRQAQAMKDILIAVEDNLESTGVTWIRF
ncbi:hypothetical protein ACR6C2_33465 [Streptomyces sp. INA 01156]